MASSEKLNKGRKVAKRNKIIVGLIIALGVLIIAGYIIHITGVLPKTVTAVKIVETDENGHSKTIKKASVLETQFHYREVYNTNAYQYMYAYGVSDFDDVADPETGKTYNEMMYDQAAAEIMNITVLGREIKNYDNFYSAADRFTESSIDEIRDQADERDWTADRLLQSTYGTGMTVNQYRKFLREEIRVQEFENYINQFELLPSEEEIQAAYDSNPTIYDSVDFNSYYFPYELDDEGNVTDTQPALDAANEVIDAVENGSDFNDAVIEVLLEDEEANASKLSAFGYVADEDGNLTAPEEEPETDPTLMEDWSFSEAETYKFEEFLFDDETEAGDTIVVEADNGVYALCMIERGTDDETTVAYRTLTLATGVSSATDSEEDILEAVAETTAEANGLVAAPMTSLEFTKLVKDNTDKADEIIDGGYEEGVTADSFEGATGAQEQLGQWLFDPARKVGDVTVIESDDHSTVTIYYFDSSVPAWMYTAQLEARTTTYNTWTSGLLANVTYDISYKLMDRFIY